MLISDHYVTLLKDKIHDLEIKIAELEVENQILRSEYEEIKFFLEKTMLMK